MLEAIQPNQAFTYKKLSQEEMESRGILGRLVGPCADFAIPTRNGRLYNEDLWNKVFDDELVKEKIENKCLFGELGHPAEREEVDPEKIALALNEPPKCDKDGRLIACFDILNTPSGKILKTLCDYGTKIGISSRGTGDLMTDATGNELVDPDTYCFECFDAVLLPAVKGARLTYMKEDLDKASLKAKKALAEEYKKASVESKRCMKHIFEELKLDVDTEGESVEEPVQVKEVSTEDDQYKPTMALVEDDKQENKEDPVEDEIEVFEEPEGEDLVVEYEVEDDEDEASDEDDEVSEEGDKIPEESENTDDDQIDVESEKDDDEDEDEIEINPDFSNVEIEPIEINNKVYNLHFVGAEEKESDDEEDIIIFKVAYDQVEEPENNKAEDASEETDEAKSIDVDSKDDSANLPAADDSGAEELMDSLKESIRETNVLKLKLKAAVDEKTVSDAEVSHLQEELKKYKLAFARTSELANTARQLDKEVTSLTEQLATQTSRIKELEHKNTQSQILNENVIVGQQKVKVLTEQLSEAQSELTSIHKKLHEQQIRANEQESLASTYKRKFTEVLNKYIDDKANMLGVNRSEITSKLSENFTVEDIEKVCDSLLNESVTWRKLPVGLTSKSKVVIDESKEQKSSAGYNNNGACGYEIDRSLLELAGLI